MEYLKYLNTNYSYVSNFTAILIYESSIIYLILYY